LNQGWKIKWRHLANDCGSNAPRFWQRENVQFIEPNIWARRGSSPNILRGLATGPLHVITNTMSVIKNGKTFKNLGPSHKLGGGAGPYWPQRRTAPAYGHRIALI